MSFLSNHIDEAGDSRIKWTQIDNCRIDIDYVETSGTIAQNWNFQQQKIKLDLLTQIRREYIYTVQYKWQCYLLFLQEVNKKNIFQRERWG